MRSFASRHRPLRAAVAAVGCLALLVIPPAQAANLRLREQDGIIAQLDLERTQAIVSWRFAHRPPALVGKVMASVNSRPVGIPGGVEVFPAAADSLLVTFLIDDGGLERALAIDEAERAVLDTIKAMPPFAHSRVAAYDTDFRLIDLRSPASASVELRAAAGPRDARSDLSRALRATILAAAVEPATRRAIYVYTDGSNAGSKALDDVGSLARSAGVSVSFVLTPSMRLADLAMLDRFAAATGGRLLTRPGYVRDDMRVFVASGARVRFPLDVARHFIWERTATLDATLDYGDAALTLSSDIETPVAGLTETMVYLWHSQRPLVLLIGAAVCVPGAAIGWRSMRRRRRKMVVA